MSCHLTSSATALVCSLICAPLLISAARADDALPAQKAVEIRQSVFKLIGWSFSPSIGPMMAGKMKFDASVAQKDAARLVALAPMIPEAFALDTHQTAGLKTRARSAIWSNLPDFKAKDEDLVKAASTLATVARSGDEAMFRAAALAVSQACRACHDTYRDD